MLARSALTHLIRWKNSSHHKALLVVGARQVGKTYLIREFARVHYQSFLEINFIETPSARRIFEGDLDAPTLIANLTAFGKTPFVPHKTLIFFDEIQECPRARTAIKFLVDDGRFDYIESGSLLGVSYKEVPSYPVGYEEVIRMYPLTLEEFFIANDVQIEALEQAKLHAKNQTRVPEVLHNRLTQLFYAYLAVGGMPAAVQEFIATNDLARVANIQKSILMLYRQDIAQYATNKAHVHAIFDHIPAELNKKNKRFKLSDLSKNARMERYESDFMWLADAGVALPCYNITEPMPPLLINTQHNLFKLFLCDVGLLNASLFESVQFDLLRGNIAINWGSLLENMVAQELVAYGYRLCYYDKPKKGEVDFVLEREGLVIPLEVKSGKDYQKHRALDNLLNTSAWRLNKALVACRSRGEVQPYVPPREALEVQKREGLTTATTKEIYYLPWYLLGYWS